MDNVLTVKGLIVRTIDMGESDRLMSVLTAEHGLLSVMGKGVRSIKSQRLHLAQLFTYCEMTISLRAGLYYLKEGTIIENFYSIRENIVSFSLAQYLAEIVSSVAVQDDNQENVLRLTLNTLFAIANNLEQPELIKATFEFRLMCEIGYSPDLAECSECGKDSLPRFFSVAEGTTLCQECIEKRNDKDDYYLIEESLFRVLVYLQNSDLKKLYAYKPEEGVRHIFYSLAENYLLYHLERNFDTLQFYKQIINYREQ
ncbi:MAG: DNA repair protein RecO [Clostridia bacterium]|nr:DNA repair protein RecO [Clostridia bacterium]